MAMLFVRGFDFRSRAPVNSFGIVQRVHNTGSISHPSDGAQRSDFVYDGLGRLRHRTEQVYSKDDDVWYVVEDLLYIYDGMRVIQDRDATTGDPTISYTRGIDLSGSVEGAGGIGGLLARSEYDGSGGWTGHAVYHADGNGNITYMLDSLDPVLLPSPTFPFPAIR